MNSLIVGPPRLALQPETTPPVHEFLRVLDRQRALLIAVALLVAAAVTAVASLLPARYTATAVVSVSPATPDPLQPSAPAVAIGDDDVATDASLMAARDLAGSIVSQTGYGLHPVFSPSHRLVCTAVPTWSACHPGAPSLDARIDSFVASLTVTPESHGRLIDLSFQDRNPATAAAMLNTLVTTFQTNQVRARGQTLDRTTSWLSQRAEELRGKWIEASAKASAFRTRYGLTSGASGGDTPVTTQETSHVAGDYAAAQAELAAAEARQSALHSQGAAQVDDPVQAAIAAQLSGLMVQQAQLRAEHGNGYPALAAMGQQVAAAEAQLGGARARALRAADTDVAARRAAVEGLGRNLAALQTEGGKLGTHEVELMRLDNEAHSAQTIYEEFLARTNEIGERTALLQPSVQFAAHAVIPTAPSAPNRPRLALAGLVLGLLAGVAVVLAREHLSRGFSNISRVGPELALPLLCTVPEVAGRHTPAELARFVADHPLSQAAEAMRAIAMHLQLSGSQPIRSLAITSATGREGKSTTCLWLAATLAWSGQRVLLIDGDHRRGTIGELLGGRGQQGVADLIEGTASFAESVQRAEPLGIDYVAAGRPMTRSFGGAELRRLRDLIAELSGRYDVVLVDSPPLLAMTDALAYANVCDRTLMMCRWRSTPRQAVANSLARLESAGARMLGVALTMVDGARLSMFSDDLRLADTKLLAGYYTTQ